jgi:Na+/melibiose symporter-like transporter
MFLIGLAGFTEREPGAPQILSQPDSATLMIRLIMVIAPLIFMSIGVLISFRYKINASRQKELAKAIEHEDGDYQALLDELSS